MRNADSSSFEGPLEPRRVGLDGEEKLHGEAIYTSETVLADLTQLNRNPGAICFQNTLKKGTPEG